MGEKLILGVDIGTSNVKALLVTLNGKVVALASEEIRSIYPAANQIEQSPDEIWAQFCSAVNKVTSDCRIDKDDIVGFGMDSNRCGLILADENYKTLTNNMTWQDFRSSAQVSDFKKNNPEIDMYRISGEDGLPMHSLYKILWCQQRIPSTWKKCRHIFLSPADYILFRLFGKQITCRSIAQSSCLFDINTLSYSETILKAANIDEAMLPALYNADEIVGSLDEAIATLLGVPKGVSVVCGLCDATASQLGSGSAKEGRFTISVGTCGAIRTFSPTAVFAEDKFSQVRVFSPFGYVPSCTISDAGSVLKWFRNNFCSAEIEQSKKSGVDVYTLIDEQASKIASGCDGLLLLPYFTGASYAIKDASVFGVFAGIRNYHTHAHFSRAVMEGVAFSLRSVLDSFYDNGFEISEACLGGGGAKSPLWTQIITDILGVTIHIPECEEASALGSAIVASVGLGLHKSLDVAVEKMVNFVGTYRPIAENVELYSKNYILFKELFDNLHEFYKHHAELTEKASN